MEAVAKSERTLLIVGNEEGTNIGGSLLRAAQCLGCRVLLLEMYQAMKAPIWIRRFNWWVRGHRPTWLGTFSNNVLKRVLELRPDMLLATGTVPIQGRTLKEIGDLGIRRVNFLTDDPWNPAHRASWFLETLPLYDHIFSPRRANFDDLSRLGCVKVSYLPFGFDESIFFPEPSNGADCSLDSDIVFAGGADGDREAYLAALHNAGFSVALYGDYWDRYAETRKLWRGYADPATLRKAIGSAKVALCLVRRANRDGNSMRTFEVPAIGACMLVEDTEEHREIFGEDGRAVVYFRDAAEMVERTRWLLAHDEERRRLARTAHDLIVNGRNTYKDRLVAMLGSGEAGRLEG